MLFSIKMRASQGASSTDKGRHISGAERLVTAAQLEQTVLSMLQRAREHEKGTADFINIKVAQVEEKSFLTVPALKVVRTEAFTNIAGAEAYAHTKLTDSGISPQAVTAAFKHLAALQTSMRGALLVSAHSGDILPLKDPLRGVRVTNMDAAQPLAYQRWLSENNLRGLHAYEAIILATKVVSCPQVLGEICKSDDPGYTTGYVTDATHYYRIENFKELGNDIGGRVFFVDDRASDYNPTALIDYLENQTVLISV